MRSTTAYAVVESKGDASIVSTMARVGYAVFGIETSVHVRPWSLVNLISPFVVPTHMVPAATGDGAIEAIVGGRGPPLGGEAVSGDARTPRGKVRSGLNCRQSAPPLVVVIRY